MQRHISLQYPMLFLEDVLEEILNSFTSSDSMNDRWKFEQTSIGSIKMKHEPDASCIRTPHQRLLKNVKPRTNSCEELY